MNALQWVGVIAAIWFAAAVLVAVFWHRARKAQPKVAQPKRCEHRVTVSGKCVDCDPSMQARVDGGA